MGDKNDPMMPLAWFRTYSSPDQGAEGQAFYDTGRFGGYAGCRLETLVCQRILPSGGP